MTGSSSPAIDAATAAMQAEWTQVLGALRDTSRRMLELASKGGAKADEDEEAFEELSLRAQATLVDLGMRLKRAVGEKDAKCSSTQNARAKLHSEVTALGSSKYILNHYNTRIAKTLKRKSKYTAADLDLMIDADSAERTDLIEEADLTHGPGEVVRVDDRYARYKRRLLEEKKQRDLLVETFREVKQKKDAEQKVLDESNKFHSALSSLVAQQMDVCHRIQAHFETSKYRTGLIDSGLADRYLPLPLHLLLAQAAVVARSRREVTVSVGGNQAALEEYVSFVENEKAVERDLVLLHPLHVAISLQAKRAAAGDDPTTPTKAGAGAGTSGAVTEITLRFHYHPELGRVFLEANPSGATVQALRSMIREDHGTKLERLVAEKREEAMDAAEGHGPSKRWKFPSYFSAQRMDTLRSFHWVQRACKGDYTSAEEVGRIVQGKATPSLDEVLGKLMETVV